MYLINVANNPSVSHQFVKQGYEKLIMKSTETIRIVLIKCIEIVTIVFFFSFLLAILVESIMIPNEEFWPGVFGNISIKIGIVVGILWVFLLFLVFIRHINRSKKEKSLKAITSVLFICTLAVQFMLVIFLKWNMTWDNSKIFDCAIAFANGAEPLNDFLGMYPHQAGAAIETAIFIKLFKLLGIPFKKYVLGLQLTMILFMDLSIWIFLLFCKKSIADKIALNKIVCTAWFVSLLSPGVTLFGGLFYPTVSSLPFFSASIYCFASYLFESNKKKNILYVLGGCLSAFVGFRIRATIIIVVIAFLIMYLYKLIRKETHKKSIPQVLGLLFLSWFIVSMIWQYVFSFYCGNRNTELQLPITNWVMIGVEDYGLYHADKEVEILEISGYEEKNAYIKEQIITMIKERGPVGMVFLFKDKINIMWVNGEKDVHDLFSQSSQYNSLHEWICGNRRGLFVFYSHLINAFTFFCLLLGMIVCIKNKQLDPIYLFFVLIMVGNFLFYLFWEVQMQYFVSIEPLIVLLSTNGIISFSDRIKSYNKYSNTAKALAIIVPIFVLCMIIKTYDHSVNTEISDNRLSVYQGLGTMKTALLPGNTLRQTFMTNRPFSNITVNFKNIAKDKNDVDYKISLTSDRRGEIWTDTIKGKNIPFRYFYSHKNDIIYPEKDELFSIIIEASDGNVYVELYSYNLNFFDAYPNGDLFIKVADDTEQIINGDIVLFVSNMVDESFMKPNEYFFLTFIILLITCIPSIYILFPLDRLSYCFNSKSDEK